MQRLKPFSSNFNKQVSFFHISQASFDSRIVHDSNVTICVLDS